MAFILPDNEPFHAIGFTHKSLYSIPAFHASTISANIAARENKEKRSQFRFLAFLPFGVSVKSSNGRHSCHFVPVDCANAFWVPIHSGGSDVLQALPWLV